MRFTPTSFLGLRRFLEVPFAPEMLRHEERRWQFQPTLNHQGLFKPATQERIGDTVSSPILPSVRNYECKTAEAWRVLGYI